MSADATHFKGSTEQGNVSSPVEGWRLCFAAGKGRAIVLNNPILMRMEY